MVFSRTATAHDLWLSLATLFTDNKHYRAVQLEEKFKSLKKGSLYIHDYCQAIKNTADNLADVGNPVSDKQLVLQTLHGLPKSYGTVANLISFQSPLPSFFQTRSLLQMEETCLQEPEPETTIMYAAPTPPISHGNSGRGRGRNGHRAVVVDGPILRRSTLVSITIISNLGDLHIHLLQYTGHPFLLFLAQHHSNPLHMLRRIH